jgi:hypothetical protein
MARCRARACISCSAEARTRAVPVCGTKLLRSRFTLESWSCRTGGPGSGHQELLALEKQFWTGGPDFYRKNLDDQCLVAFTEMAAVMSKEQVASTIKEGQRWKNLDIKEKGFLEIDNGVAVLTYQATAKKPNGEDYKALVSSGYARRDGAWKMVFHQQTPLAA